MIRKELYLYFKSVLLFITFAPYFAWTSAMSTYSFIVFSLLLLPNINKKYLINRNLLLISIVLVTKIFFDCFFSFSVTSVVGFLLLIFIYVDPDYRLEILQRFKTIVAIIFLCSLIVYILVVFLYVDLPHDTVDPLNNTKNYLYDNYYFLIVPSNCKDLQVLYRFHALFEEPGNVSTIVTTLLLMDRFKLNNWKNIILFISGIATFSLFFYVITILYFLINFRSIFSRNVAIPLGVIIVSIICFFNQNNSDIDITRLVYNRLAIKDGQLGGNNRSTGSFDSEYESLDSSETFFGKGVDAHMKIAPGIQTYKMIIYDYGLIYVILSITPLFLYGIISCKTNYKVLSLFIIYILLFYYQRPSFLYTPGIFYMFLSLPCALLKYRK